MEEGTGWLNHAKRPGSPQGRTESASRSFLDRAALSLEHRQAVVVQLHDDAIDRGRVDRARAPAAGAGPASVRSLGAENALEVIVAVFAPGKVFRVGGLGIRLGVHHPCPAILADEVDRG